MTERIQFESKILEPPDNLASTSVVRAYITAVLHEIYDTPCDEADEAAAKWARGFRSLGRDFLMLEQPRCEEIFGQEHGQMLYQYRNAVRNRIFAEQRKHPKTSSFWSFWRNVVYIVLFLIVLVGSQMN